MTRLHVSDLQRESHDVIKTRTVAFYVQDQISHALTRELHAIVSTTVLYARSSSNEWLSPLKSHTARRLPSARVTFTLRSG